jgi:hypothetical protein
MVTRAAQRGSTWALGASMGSRYMMKRTYRIIVAGIAGAVLCLLTIILVLNAIYVGSGYTREGLIDPPSWLVLALLTLASVFSVILEVVFCGVRLPDFLGHIARGSAYGVAVVVLVTLLIASLRGQTSRERAPYLWFGLQYGVPTGLLLGGITAAVVKSKRTGGLR